jgi:EmrB/QacA subfamily drug resistance transporter
MTTTPSTASTGPILAVLFTGVLMGALDIAIVGPALPALRAEFGVDERALAWVLTIYVLFNLIGTPIMAKLSDRLGRRLVYTLDVALFAAGSLLVASARSFEQLLVGRAVQAFGAGGIFPVASAVIGDALPPEKRGRALGMIGAVFGVAFLVGPLLAGLLLGFGWRWLFLINLPIAAVLMVASWRLLPAARAAAPSPFDWSGVLALSLTLAGLALALNNLDAAALARSLASAQVWPWLVAASVGLLWTIVAERRAVDPIVKPAWFASGQIRLVAALAAAAGLGEAAMVFLPDLAVVALGVTPQAATWMLLPIVLTLAIGAPVLGRLLDHTGPRPIIIAALVMLALGCFALALLPTTRPVLLGAGVLVGLGLSGLLGAPLRYVLLNEVSAQERGASQGLLTLFTSIGMMLSGVLIGGIAASAGGGASGYREAFGLIGIVTVGMVVMSFALANRRASKVIDAEPGATAS